MNNGLIYDVGFHVGEDTDFYLKKGYWVVAIEANPALAEAGRIKFREAIDSGRLIIENVGISDKAGVSPFYLNKRLTEWSSLHHGVGTTRGDFDVIEIKTKTLADVVLKYGMPIYIKLDIEGLDLVAAKSLQEFEELPQYISIENGRPFEIEAMFEMGYKKFKFVNQKYVSDIKLPHPSCHGKDIQYQFSFGSSGPFGEEAPGVWLSKDEVLLLSNQYWGNKSRNPDIDGWYDLHASL